MRLAFVYVTDENGFELMQHSAVSLALSQLAPTDIHVFCYRFLPSTSSPFTAAMAGLCANVFFHEISDATVDQHQTCLHVTTPSLLKLLAVERLIGDYDRVVYLDNDLLVFDNLMIEDIDFKEMPIAAVIDMDLTDSGALRHTSWAPGGGKSNDLGSYFNSGFMAFASRNWRDGGFMAEYAAALDRHDVACPYKISCTSIDQCAVNSVFENIWIKLAASYNLQAGAKFTSQWKSAAVRHYCGRQKFIPVTAFRNDTKDVRYLNEIRNIIGLTEKRCPSLYEIPFRLNVARKYHEDRSIRGFLKKYSRATRIPDVSSSADLQTL